MRWYLAISVSILQILRCLAFVLVEYAGIRCMWNKVLPYLKRWLSLLTLFFTFQKCKSYAFIFSVMASDYVHNLAYCAFFSYCSFTISIRWHGNDVKNFSLLLIWGVSFMMTSSVLETVFSLFMGVFIVEIQREQLFCLVCHNRWWISLYLYLGKCKSGLCRLFFHTVC